MTQKYFELEIKPKKDYDVFLDLIESIVADAIEESENKSIIIRSEESLEDIKSAVVKFSEALDIECEISYLKKDSIDWIKNYQDSIKPVIVGSFYIRPSWEKSIDDKINILIDPALAFGSGHHETTSSCIEAIDKYVKKDDELLDVGTGSGILAIASAKKGAKVDICDTDEICIDSSISNFKINNETINNSWVGSVNGAKSKYDVVIANIIADILVMISNDLKISVKDDGILILSGILDKYENRVKQSFNDLELKERIQKNEWLTLVFKKTKEI
ncbi:50S ribosomal protein L11 methyltransferase [Arcobacter porcinus]|uniref:Ribosomal protein L11 methyltransferase n=1 Tax=Arcobacter porcinus TaxID=1935204 RepID=A0ABX2YG18_9BACT|nr:50S ribosomal protein L11 methyltransferase [Arcobacter porcinus]OCL83003.1 Ribosomal protein L11 methyltransferase [Arcobacter porcinus]OCL84369.1 Ribosomal protein L11 methyltransferase [Arcobacter porcinus]OCL88909.1 Ribosomal protein L11 methyltransferase [Arcobacter porcinus]OCL93649.1 Ribosomal protein L11 methyltransferase [Arcobacter porcinus]